MSKKESINNFLKHKRLIIVSLLAIGFIVLILLIYVLTYANNKPKPFASDSNVKITNKCDYFTFSVVAEEIDLKGSSDGKPSLDVKGKITNLSEKITNVTVSYEVHTNWTTKTDFTSSNSTNFNSGNALTPSTTSEYYSDLYTLNLSAKYPVKVMPLVRVKKPTLYAKVTYTRNKPDSMHGEGGTVTESVYYKLSYNDYYVDGITKII